MDGPQHYREAEILLLEAAQEQDQSSKKVSNILAAAMVHTNLAQTAAIFWTAVPLGEVNTQLLAEWTSATKPSKTLV